MLKTGQDQNDKKHDWQKTDARVLGQILAAQNILFVLPDTKRIAEFFAQALVSVPGVTSCRVCLGDVSVQAGLDSDVCRECEALRKAAGETLAMPFGFKCRLAGQHDIRIIVITLETSVHTHGFFVFRTDTTGVFESYKPFVNNLSNYIALSLENRLQKNLLQKGEEKFRDIYDKSPIGIEVYDSSGALLDINKACLDIFGIADIEDVKGFKLFEDPNITDAVKKKLIEGETVRYEAPFDFEKVKEYRLYKTTKSGFIHLDVLITPLGLKEEVDPAGYLLQVQDITARKLAEDELKKYQEHLEDIIKERTAELTAANKQLYQEINERKQAEEKLVQQSRTLDSFFKYTITPLVILDRDFNFIRVNEAYAAACKRDASEFPGHNHFEFYPSDARIIFEQVVETKEPYQTLARPFTYPDHPEWGVTYWDWILTPILSDTDEVEFLVFSLKDVTERKRAEDQLRLDHEILTNITDAVYLVRSSDGAIVFASRQFEQMFGYNPGELIGKHVSVVNAPGEKSPEETATRITEELNKQGIWCGEVLNIRKDGTAFWCDASVTSLTLERADYGTVWVSVHRDITERKKAEEELNKYRDHLEILVKERTADLRMKTDELEQANIKLVELDHLKSIFIASMSHELRTPLNSIIGFSSILLHEWIGTVAPEQKEKLSTILRAGKHLLNLINDVIDVSKIEAGNIETASEDFDLFELIAEALAFFKNDIEKGGLELTVEAIHQGMHTDRRRLLQCVINLVSNAVKFTEKGSVRITAQRVKGQVSPTEGAEARGKDEENEDFIEISVADTGIGIREEDMSKLFFAFVRLPSPISLNVKGTGLGLYLTKKVAVEILKGEITVKSKYDEGSIFSLRIPVRL